MSKQKASKTAMTKTTLRIPADLHKRLKLHAVKHERDMAEVVADALERYLKRRDRGQT